MKLLAIAAIVLCCQSYAQATASRFSELLAPMRLVQKAGCRTEPLDYSRKNPCTPILGDRAEFHKLSEFVDTGYQRMEEKKEWLERIVHNPPQYGKRGNSHTVAHEIDRLTMTDDKLGLPFQFVKSTEWEQMNKQLQKFGEMKLSIRKLLGQYKLWVLQTRTKCRDAADKAIPLLEVEIAKIDRALKILASSYEQCFAEMKEVNAHSELTIEAVACWCFDEASSNQGDGSHMPSEVDKYSAEASTTGHHDHSGGTSGGGHGAMHSYVPQGLNPVHPRNDGGGIAQPSVHGNTAHGDVHHGPSKRRRASSSRHIQK
ncbi:hypothetical protein SeLEV6574_g04906 [Synchytrium endobioticum]|uniref:Uncharacterized protein n=1 Tax=Synchytrium endobioticum TaxID=286115 RepID=A0A507CX08_9FUNG|nr:hypothetical protein SeLEV6574_g04906 [Synchytrium endobioticum]